MSSKVKFHIHELVEKQARLNPDAIAVIDADGTNYTYDDYQSATVDMAGILRDHGVKEGDRVLLVAENCFFAAVTIFAASLVGAFCIPVNARMTNVEIARIIKHATPCVAAFTTGISNEAKEHAKTAKATDVLSDYGSFSIANVGPNDPAPDEVNSDKSAVILYTTGTTGDPKGVMLTHNNLHFGGKASADLRQMKPEDCIYGVLPITHVFGLTSMLIASAYAGATVQLEARFIPQRVYDALLDRVSVFPGVPQMHALLMQYTNEQGFTQLNSTKLRYVSSGGAPLDPAWKRKAEAFYGIALQNGYGLTESTSGVSGTLNPIGVTDTSVGKALPGIEIKLDTSLGSSNDENTGEILTRGPHVMKGYFRNPEETSKTVDLDGWLRSGDLGQIDEEGNLHVVGRSKELIIRGGFNVYPPEVEAALNDHPEVIQSAVIGQKLDDGNEQILAFVECKSPEELDHDKLTSFVGERLASYKRPSQIIPVKTLPATATGKILKHRLLETFQELLT